MCKFSSKPAINPFEIKRSMAGASLCEIKLLQTWDSVGDSIEDSVGELVWDWVGNAVGEPARSETWASVWDSVGELVWQAIKDSVGDGDLVKDSVGDSVGAYYSSFFDAPELRRFDCCNQLWSAGLVPSFDGKAWRLHSGKDAKVVFEITKEELVKK